MNTVATLIVNRSDPILSAGHTRLAVTVLEKCGATQAGTSWLDDTIAADVFFTGVPVDDARHALSEAFGTEPIDVIVQPATTRRKSMLIADMDSTMIEIECIDELADFVGLKEKVAAITEAAMQGELDFDTALYERVSLLADMEETVLQQVYDQRLTFTSGAEALVKTMAGNGALTVLVSGGFTFFTARVAKALGFAIHKANVLEANNGQLTGAVIPPIVNATTKLETLRQIQGERALESHAILAVGDGANDIPMITAAGLGIAYHAKEKAARAADAAINHSDLSALLYAQGYRSGDFVT